MIMQDNHRNPKTVHHSQEEMEKAFQMTDANKARYYEMRRCLRIARTNPDSFAIRLNALAQQSVSSDGNTKHREE